MRLFDYCISVTLWDVLNTKATQAAVEQWVEQILLVPSRIQALTRPNILAGGLGQEELKATPLRANSS